MAKTVVVYKSKYGTTQTYAEWIAEAVGAQLFKAGEISAAALQSYDTIVYCGALYAGGMIGFSLIKKNYQKLKDKRLIVVAVGATLHKEDALQEVADKNFLPEMCSSVQLFLLRGGMDYKKMNLLHRTMMVLLVRSLKAKDPATLDEDGRGIIGAYRKTVNFTNKRFIEPVVQAINA